MSSSPCSMGPPPTWTKLFVWFLKHYGGCPRCHGSHMSSLLQVIALKGLKMSEVFLCGKRGVFPHLYAFAGWKKTFIFIHITILPSVIVMALPWDKPALTVHIQWIEETHPKTLMPKSSPASHNPSPRPRETRSSCVPLAFYARILNPDVGQNWSLHTILC